MFVDLTYSITLTVIRADSLPFHVYVFFPSALLFSTTFLVYIVPSLASIEEDSTAVLCNIRQSVPHLVGADRETVQYLKRVVGAQHPFGFRLGIFCYASLSTAQDIINNSISYALLAITLVKEASG